MEISKMLSLNSAHVKRKTWRRIVDGDIEPLTICKQAYPEAASTPGVRSIAAHLIYFNKRQLGEYSDSGEVPVDLMRILYFANDMGATILRLTPDCAYLPYLPAYKDDNSVRLATTQITARIDKILTLNSAHITKQTDQKLAKGIPLSSFSPYEKLIDDVCYGRIVYPGTPINETAKQCNLEQVPADLLMCAAFAKTTGADAICFDGDGPVIEQLPVYTWDN